MRPVDGAPFDWQIQSLVLQVADADARPDHEAWERLAARLPREPLADPRSVAPAVEAWLGVSRSRVARGEHGGAAEALGRAQQLLDAGGQGAADDALRAQFASLQARSACARGAPQEAVPWLDAMLRLRPADGGNHARVGIVRAALARHLRAAGDANGAARETGLAEQSLRAVVAAYGPTVARQPHDPWYVVPFGFAQIELAELAYAAGDRDTAREQLDSALPALAGVAHDAHADQWLEDRHAAALALRRQLDQATRQR